MRRKVLGNKHRDVSASLNNLAEVLTSKGEYESAESLYRESVELNRELLGPIPKTGNGSIVFSGMDARKGGCKDAIKSMAVFGWVLGVCGAVVAGARERRPTGSGPASARRSGCAGRDPFLGADRLPMERLECDGDLFQFDISQAVSGMDEGGRVSETVAKRTGSV